MYGIGANRTENASAHDDAIGRSKMFPAMKEMLLSSRDDLAAASAAFFDASTPSVSALPDTFERIRV